MNKFKFYLGRALVGLSAIIAVVAIIALIGSVGWGIIHLISYFWMYLWRGAVIGGALWFMGWLLYKLGDSVLMEFSRAHEESAVSTPSEDELDRYAVDAYVRDARNRAQAQVRVKSRSARKAF